MTVFSKYEFAKISIIIWGGVIIDQEWAEGTLVFKMYIDKHIKD